MKFLRFSKIIKIFASPGRHYDDVIVKPSDLIKQYHLNVENR